MRNDPNSLVRKQFLITRRQAEKIEKLAGAKGVAATEMLRRAIDAYDPEVRTVGGDAPKLMELVHDRLKEAMQATQEAARVVTSAIEEKPKAR